MEELELENGQTLKIDSEYRLDGRSIELGLPHNVRIAVDRFVRDRNGNRVRFEIEQPRHTDLIDSYIGDTLLVDSKVITDLIADNKLVLQ